MTSEKIKRLVELLVEREVRQLIPGLKKQIIKELTSQTNKSPIIENSMIRDIKKTKRYSSDPLLNELISSTRPTITEDNEFDDDVLQALRTPQHFEKPLSVREMVSSFATNPEANVNLQSEAVQQTLNIMNRDYSKLVKKMNEKK